jgi:hypothetical protein
MDHMLEQRVRNRAGNRCEYCGLPQQFSRLKGGPTIESNLALSCGFCNRHKRPNIAGIVRKQNS